jgi:hypothetical protein
LSTEKEPVCSYNTKSEVFILYTMSQFKNNTKNLYPSPTLPE